MMRPGDWLRAFASRLCPAETVTRLVDPVIADLQFEYKDALRRGRPWRARYVRFVGTLALWKVIAHGGPGPNRPGFRVLAWWAAGTVAVSVALLAWPMTAMIGSERVIQHATPGELGWLMLLLVPQALPLAIPAGNVLAILFGVERPATPRGGWTVLAGGILAALLIIPLFGWVLPEANQAWRQLVAHRALVRGANEMTFGALRAGGLLFYFHERLALSFATLALGAAVHALVRTGWRTSICAVAGLFACVGYFASYHFVAAPLALSGAVPAWVGAWAPNALFGALTILVVRLKPNTTYSGT